MLGLALGTQLHSVQYWGGVHLYSRAFLETSLEAVQTSAKYSSPAAPILGSNAPGNFEQPSDLKKGFNDIVSSLPQTQLQTQETMLNAYLSH